MTATPIRHTVLDHGYIFEVEHWGSDERIIEAARMSTDKGFRSWDDYTECRQCGDWWNEYGRSRTCNCGDGRRRAAGDWGLLNHLWKKKHSSPFEMAGLVVEVQAPILVFRQWHRHRTQSVNELSGRYTPLPDVNYIPSIERIMEDFDKANRQAGVIAGASTITKESAISYQEQLQLHYEEDERLYQRSLKAGVPKEVARTHLPVGRYSRMRSSANLLNWTKFLTLRCAPDAQWEIRQYADALRNILALRFPKTMFLWKHSFPRKDSQ